MIIAIDYDDTYTEDPELWDAFIIHAQDRGHTVIMATQRVEPWLEEPNKVCVAHGMTLVASSLRKREACSISGFKVDVWIDDSPEGVCHPRRYIGGVEH